MVKCFKKCGIIFGESVVVAWIGANEDSFIDVDEARRLTALVDELGLHDSTCSPEKYVIGDDNLPVCDDTSGDWDEHFLAGLSGDQADIAEELEDQQDDSYDLEPPFPKIKTYKEAVFAIEDIQAILDFKGHNELSIKLETHINSIVRLQYAHTCKPLYKQHLITFKNFLCTRTPKTRNLSTTTTYVQQSKYHFPTVAAIEGFHCSG